MTRKTLVPLTALALALGLAPLGALAREHSDKSHSHDDHRTVIVQGAPGCPPGLAKKGNGCTPPGLAKPVERVRVWEPGERITNNYIVVRDPSRYRLDPRYTYWQSGDYLYRVDSQTGKVLNLIGAISALLN